MKTRLVVTCLVVLGCGEDPQTSGDDTTSATTSSSGADTGADTGADSTGAGVGCPALVEEAEALAADGFSGVLAVVQAGEPLLFSAHGECIRDPATACDTTSVFDIGSITKQFTAAAILALQEDGVLSVDDTIDLHFAGVPADKAGITLHQLLTHSAGFAESIGDDYDPLDRDAWLASALAMPLVHEPGETYLYSNVGYSVLAAIVELRAGTSYEEYLHSRLLQPAGLGHTGYVMPDFADVVVAHGYTGDVDHGAPNELPWDTTGPWWNLRGNGGILSNADDLLAWHVALSGDDVLSADSKAAMYTPWIDEGEGDSFYGYGWVVIDVPGAGTVITHNGGNDVFFADLVRFVDQDLVVVVLDNAWVEAHDEIAGTLAEVALTDCG